MERLRVDERDRIGIMGRNGAGKTSLLNILAGLTESHDRQFIERTAGRILQISDKAVALMKGHTENMRRVGGGKEPSCATMTWRSSIEWR
ncbi:ATP-binding cassette domain-containing protein [Paenibacillus sp. UNC451MF]|uniref:ATP-binding cassette domain-containing protein n=1 Tax=Paenibacillus sp. UNC451MF TaxID=1449063 RepID=UPI00048BA6A1|nr:ATP-binding cassette domain-containing protein [Paenibacillus sp. UNC451MF]